MSTSKHIGVVLIRVFSDTRNIGYYSVIHEDDCITLLPIAETRELTNIPDFMDLGKIIDKCTGSPLRIYYRFSRYYDKPVHNDPRVDLGFYTEEAKPSRLPQRKLREGDIVLFTTGLANYPDDVWYVKSKSTFTKILKELRTSNKIGIYVIGGLIVEKKINIENSQWDNIIDKYPVLLYSPHYYRLDKRDTFAILGRGFKIEPPLKIASITRDGYKVSQTLIELIGRENTDKLVKQNFRKSKYIKVGVEKIERLIEPFIEYY